MPPIDDAPASPGDPAAAAARLIRLPTDKLPGSSAWTAEERDRLRWSLVGVRDEGRLHDALTGLKVAARVWPEDPIFVIEALLVLEMIGASAGDVIDLVETLPEAVRFNPVVDLFVSRRLRVDQRDEAAAAMERLSRTPPEAFGAFRHVHADFLMRAADDAMWQARLAYLADAPPNVEDVDRLLESGSARAFAKALGERLLSAAHAEHLPSMAERFAFINELSIPNAPAMTLAALEGVVDRLPPDGHVARLWLWLAMSRADKARAVIDQLIWRDDVVAHAGFVRAAFVCAARLKDPALERLVLRRWNPDGAHERHDVERDKSRRFEIEARRRALNVEAPIRVFVGIFGQLREPEAVVAQSVQDIDRLFADSPYGVFELHRGLSTWTKLGRRDLALHHGAGFFAHSAPTAVHRLLVNEIAITGHDVAAKMPTFAQTMCDEVAAQGKGRVESSDLEPLLPPGSTIVIDDEEPVDERIALALSKHDTLGRHYVNQFKMWSRIARLKPALEAQEAQTGARMDVCLFHRCDLKAIEGNLAETACTVIAPECSRDVYYDYDRHAEFREGSGDRVIILARDQVDAIFDAYEVFLREHEQAGYEDRRSRIECHAGLQSMIVRNGLTPVTIKSLGYQIHRQVVSADRLIPALQADLAATSDPEIARRLQDAIQDLSLQTAEVAA